MKKKKGFYCIDNKIYFGDYPIEQVSGKISLSIVHSAQIRTDVPFSENDFAVRFWDNHALTEAELVNMDNGIGKIMRCIGIAEFPETDLSETEKRLETGLPKSVKILYKYLTPVLMTGNERFLSPDEMYIDGGNLVFYKIKRTPVAISLSDGVLMGYHKRKWEYSKGDESFMCFAMNRIVVKSIVQMPFTRLGKIKGALKTTISPEKELKNAFEDTFKVLEGYSNYGNIILYNENGALGWFRQNGFYADIMIGCTNAQILSELISVDISAEWE